jgi:hypothetical protein
MKAKIHFAPTNRTLCGRWLERRIRSLDKGEKREEWGNGDHHIITSQARHEVTCRKCQEAMHDHDSIFRKARGL